MMMSCWSLGVLLDVNTIQKRKLNGGNQITKFFDLDKFQKLMKTSAKYSSVQEGKNEVYKYFSRCCGLTPVGSQAPHSYLLTAPAELGDRTGRTQVRELLD